MVRFEDAVERLGRVHRWRLTGARGVSRAPVPPELLLGSVLLCWAVSYRPSRNLIQTRSRRW